VTVETVETREIKQDLGGVLDRVLKLGEAVQVTTSGNPTDVSLVPDVTVRGSWVQAVELAAVRPLPRSERDAWRADVAHVS
jgi:antitoxin (DNA-binding transcriptional repressor) of toxin-antitoxin stability system